MTDERQNIPSMSVSAVVDLLCGLYTNAVERQIPFRDLSSPFLWGAAGVGKSDGVHQLARRLEASTGKRVVVTDVRLYLYSPVDVRGVLVADERREFTKWLRPKIFDLDPGDEVINLLFLDELSAAPQSVQVVAYQLSLDRAVGEHRLPDNCIVISAGNRTTDQSVSYRMPKALCNRMKHFHIRPDPAAWRQWAVRSGIDPRVMGFLAFDASRLYTDPGPSDLAWPTPRSWRFVSEDLRTTGLPPRQIHDLIAAGIGVDAALEFESWCDVWQELPAIPEILEGRCRTYPKRHDVLYALVASLTATLRSMDGTVPEAQLENVCTYARRFPADFQSAFFTDLSAMEPLRLKLMRCPSMREWLSRNKRTL